MNKELLKLKMLEMQINQRKLASVIGISEESLSRKIRGKREFKLSEIVAIRGILGIENSRNIFFDDDIPKMQRK